MATPVSNNPPFLTVSAPPRPPSKKPSWIGRPPAPRRPTDTIMKQHVRLSYRSRGLRPPVFAVTSLSDPQWEPIEMHSKVLPDSELEFWRDFDAEVGEHQYKFRLGPGDWWALDESKPTVHDRHGNRNNVIMVKAPAQPQPHHEHSAHPTLETPLGIAIPKPDYNAHNPSPLRLSPSDPITPPMTPEMGNDFVETHKAPPHVDVHRPASAASHYTDAYRPASAASHHNAEHLLSRPASAASSYSAKSVETAHPEPHQHSSAAQSPVEKRHAGVFDAFRAFFLSLGSWFMSAFGGGARLTGAVAVFVGLAAIVYKARSAVVPSVLSNLWPSRTSTNTSMV